MKETLKDSVEMEWGELDKVLILLVSKIPSGDFDFSQNTSYPASAKLYAAKTLSRNDAERLLKSVDKYIPPPKYALLFAIWI